MRNVVMLRAPRLTWDLLGMLLSLACLVHCLALPLVVVSLPALGFRWLQGDGFHQWVAVGAGLLGGLSFVPGYLKHRQLLVPAVGVMGLLLLSYSAIAGDECCSVAGKASSCCSTAGRCCEHDQGAEFGRPTPEQRAATAAAWWRLNWTPLGGLFLIAAHGLNWGFRGCCRSCKCPA